MADSTGSKLAKAALDVGLVSADAARLVDFYTGVVGAEALDPIEIPIAAPRPPEGNNPG